MPRTGGVELRWSYASWTALSHFNLLLGLAPHTSPNCVYTSEYYQRDFLPFTKHKDIRAMVKAAPFTPGIIFLETVPRNQVRAGR
jgi:hypothetical protein